MVKTSNVALIVLIAFIVGFVLGAVAIKKYRPCVQLPVVTITRDTVTVHDTIEGAIPAPRLIEKVRTDTVELIITPSDTSKAVTVDTAAKTVHIPIEQRTYQTEDYKAVISGWRPSLDSMQVYRKTQVITNTVTKLKRPYWALTAGGGVGYTTDKKIVPYVGVSVGVVLWSK